MNNVFKKEDLACLLSEKTGFYKKNMRVVTDALEDIILECLQAATFEQDSQLTLAPGVLLIGHRVPEREAKDPRTGEVILSPEKVIPKAKFRPSVRQKLYLKKGKKKR